LELKGIVHVPPHWIEILAGVLIISSRNKDGSTAEDII
jgi:hypothetical protein